MNTLALPTQPSPAVPTATTAALPMAQPVTALLVRDLRLALRRPAEVAAAALFFVVVVSLFPLALGSDAALLQRVGPGAVWVAALLASLLPLRRLFEDDLADGSLDALALGPAPLWAAVLAKCAAQWLSSGAVVTLLSPLLAVQFGLSGPQAALLLLGLLLGTPVLTLLGAVGAALTAGLRSAAVLTSLIVLPLCVPVLVFGAGMVEAQAAGLPMSGHLSLLGAALLASVVGAPFAAAAALRLAVEST